MAETGRQHVIKREMKTLKLHPATALIPPAPGERLDHVSPVGIVGDRILTGREQFENARRKKLREISAVVIDIGSDDDVEMYVLDHALKSQYLTDDQRAALAVEYAERLSKRMRRERAKKAAAVRHGAASRTPATEKQDARALSCDRFQIQSKRFRQVRKLRNQHPEMYIRVRDGSMALKMARQTAVQQEIARQENHRAAAAPADGGTKILHGDAREIIPTLPNNHFTAMITDPPYGVNFRQEWREGSEVAVVGDADAHQAVELFTSVLNLADSKLRPDAFLLSFVPAKHEPEFRSAVASMGWVIIGHLIWVKNTRVIFPQLNIASRHERMLLAVRGGAKLRKPISDFIGHGKTHASKHPCEKPVALLAEIIEATTVRGEAVLDPFAGSGSTLLAAIQLGRKAIGIEIVARWYDEATRRLELSPDEYVLAGAAKQTSKQTPRKLKRK